MIYSFINSAVTKRNKKQLFILAVISVFAAISELISLGAVLPFMTAIATPDYFDKYLNEGWMNYGGNENKFLVITLVFCSAVVLSAIVRLLFLKYSTKVAADIGAGLGDFIFRNFLYREYSFYIENNSNTLQSILTNDVNVATFQVVLPAIVFVSSMVMSLSIIALLCFVEPRVAVAAVLLFGTLYCAIAMLIKAKLLKNGLLITNESACLVKRINEAFGSIRDILLSERQEYYCRRFQNSDTLLRQAQGDNVFISQCPRYIMESCGIIIIAIGAMLMVRGGDIEALPIIGLFALASQRLLPTLQQIYWSFVNIKSGYPSLARISNITKGESKYNFKSSKGKQKRLLRSIKFNNVSYRYNGKEKQVLSDINLEIYSGSKIGIIGETGSGKSTFLNLLLGMLHPNEGTIYYDDDCVNKIGMAGWKSAIAYVPQEIYIIDGSVYENVAIGLDYSDIDHEQVKFAIRQARLTSYVESLTDGYHTNLGDKGIKLSGGQRQRIGIARALYRKAQIIILDEATSALDVKTESDVMREINELDGDLTFIIVAHRTSTIAMCDNIYSINETKLVKIK